MARVIIVNKLKDKIFKKFKGESKKVLNLIYSLKENPKKGKFIGSFSGIVLKELKYGSFRFYFVTEGAKLKVLDEEELTDLLIKFVRMSDKKSQQKAINEIKQILQKIGPQGLF